MQSDILISVIVPTCKPANYLWQCLDSLERQTMDKDSFEVVLVLNGTCEPYQSQILQYKAEHETLNLRYTYTEIAGVSNARNLALDAAQGEFVTFLDDDDYLSCSCLEEMLQVADHNTIACCYPYAFSDGRPEQQIDYYLTKSFLSVRKSGLHTINSVARKLLSGPCMKLIHKSIIGNRRFATSLQIGEDSVFMFAISDKINGLSYTSDDSKYYRRYRNGSVTLSRTLSNVVSQNIKCMSAYTKWYIRGGYSSYLYLTRMMAGILQIIRAI